MSQQRCLLILLGLLLACSLQAQSTFSLINDAAVFHNDSKTGIFGANLLYINHKVSPELQLDLWSDLAAYDHIILPHPQKINHNARIGAKYRIEDFDVRADYRNTIFGSSLLMGLYPDWEPMTSQQRRMQHQGTFKVDYTGSFLDVNAYSQVKHLRYTPYVLNLETFELEKQNNTGVTDVYYGLTLKAPIVPGISTYISANHKDGLFAEDGQYRLTGISAGLNADYNVLPTANISATFNWTNRTGVAIESQRRNLLVSGLRYRHKISSTLAGYLFYVNNSCINSDLNQLYLISNYLRAQVQYSIPTDPSAGSYLLIGGKYSPENKASAYFAEADYRIWNNLYTGAALNLQPDRQTTYSGKVSYYYNPVNEIHIQYTHRDNSHLNFETDYIGLGSSIYW